MMYSINEIIKRRGISRLVHFTHLDNLHSILQNGLVPRKLLENHGASFKHNDDLRLDKKKDHSCLSIALPNSGMFYRYRKIHGDFQK